MSQTNTAFTLDAAQAVPMALPEDPRRHLQSLFDELRGAPAWPWELTTLTFHLEHTLPMLYERLEDEAEAGLWRERMAGEIARLDACSLPF